MEPKQSNKVPRKYIDETEGYLKTGHEKKHNPAEPLKLPKKRDFRMRAHCNVLSGTPFPL